MAGAQSKRQSRKRRRAAASAKRSAAAPQPRSAREAVAQPPSQQRRHQQGAISATLTGRTYGDRPANPFGGIPVSEIAIVIGTVGIIVGAAAKAAPALLTGVIVCTLAVAEFSAREHFSGYRSHTLLLAAIPAVAIGAGVVALIGGSVDRRTIVFVVVPIFAILALFLRKRFRTARHSRSTRPPGR